jgi:hypothetical protein
MIFIDGQILQLAEGGSIVEIQKDPSRFAEQNHSFMGHQNKGNAIPVNHIRHRGGGRNLPMTDRAMIGFRPFTEDPHFMARVTDIFDKHDYYLLVLLFFMNQMHRNSLG